MTAPVFPPLFAGRDAGGAGDPFALACAAAAEGCDAGLVVYDLGADRLRAAIVFAPEEPLRDSAIVFAVCGVGFQNALGVLAPPEVAVHLEWTGAVRVNGGRCGRLHMAAAGKDPGAVPGWLTVGLELDLWPKSEDTGLTPDDTALYAEGCADVDPAHLLETWVRHTLVWLDTWAGDGAAALHREWIGLVHGIGGEIDVRGRSGTFVGTDERFGLLLRDATGTRLVPLTDLLEDIP